MLQHRRLCQTDRRYGKAITMDDYREDFMRDDEAQRKEAVKRLTRKIGAEVRQMTVNSPDWLVGRKRDGAKTYDRDTAYAAKMAREILWEQERDLPLSDYVDVAQR